MKDHDLGWQINEFMIYCRGTLLRERTMYSYEQALRLFERRCADEYRKAHSKTVTYVSSLCVTYVSIDTMVAPTFIFDTPAILGGSYSQ